MDAYIPQLVGCAVGLRLHRLLTRPAPVRACDVADQVQLPGGLGSDAVVAFGAPVRGDQSSGNA
jgi:hypothetical protein